MFKRWGQNSDEDITVESAADNNEVLPVEEINRPETRKTKNTILKGSKLIGDINVSCDLELSGEIEGNITSEQDSNIFIRGICRGNIETKEGSVDIEGELQGGNIIAGSNVRISGKFSGGEIKAKGMVSINGEFDGKLEGSEIEIGPDAQGKGELLYKNYISISKGANIEGHIRKVPTDLKLVKNKPESGKANKKAAAQEIQAQEASGAK